MTAVFGPWDFPIDVVSPNPTLSSLDFAYVASTYTTLDTGREFWLSDGPTDIGNLISLAAEEVGVTLPVTLAGIAPLCTDTIPVIDALRVRGALVFSSTNAGITLGLNDVITLAHGLYSIYRVDTSDTQWLSAARVPGLLY